MKNLVTALAMGLLVTSPAALAGDAQAGASKAVVCAACHGADGKATIPGYPNLAGQNEQYLISSIKAYRDGNRKPVGNAAVMAAQAANLSDEDIANLAAYYAQM